MPTGGKTLSVCWSSIAASSSTGPTAPSLRPGGGSRRRLGFDYRFEVFAPAAKREYGYYVMPILEGERLVGRVDPQFQRDRGVLAIRRVYWEPNVTVTR